MDSVVRRRICEARIALSRIILDRLECQFENESLTTEERESILREWDDAMRESDDARLTLALMEYKESNGWPGR
jgi:hypothetical protein